MSREKLLAAFEALASFVPESKPFGFTKRNEMYSDGDEKRPLASEGMLYPLFGKDDARSVLTRFHALREAIEALPPTTHEPVARFEVDGQRYEVFAVGEPDNPPLIGLYRKLRDAIDVMLDPPGIPAPPKKLEAQEFRKYRWEEERKQGAELRRQLNDTIMRIEDAERRRKGERR